MEKNSECDDEPLKMLTTIAALAYKDGVILAAVPQNHIEESFTSDKHSRFVQLEKNIFCIFAGQRGGEAYEGATKLAVELQQDAKDYRREIKVVEAARRLQLNVYKLKVNFIVAGFDTSGVHVYQLHDNASMHRVPYCAGGVDKQGIYANLWKWELNMSEGKAKQLLQRAMICQLQCSMQPQIFDICVFRKNGQTVFSHHKVPPINFMDDDCIKNSDGSRHSDEKDDKDDEKDEKDEDIEDSEKKDKELKRREELNERVEYQMSKVVIVSTEKTPVPDFSDFKPNCGFK